MGLCLLLLQVGSAPGRLVRGLGGARADGAGRGTTEAGQGTARAVERGTAGAAPGGWGTLLGGARPG
jgi:hypothetical protein